MNILFFDDPLAHSNLLPFTYLRPVSHIRVGILTIQEKWRMRLKEPVSHVCERYLQSKFPPRFQSLNWYINAAACPNEPLVRAVAALAEGQSIWSEQGELIACCSPACWQNPAEIIASAQHMRQILVKPDFTILRNVWDIFRQNRTELIADFQLLTQGRKSQPITDPHTVVYGKEQVFLEEGATVKAAVLNAETGPIYLGVDSVVPEGSLIRGAFALCEGAQLNLGAKMRGDTTVGPWCKVGGEVSNSVFFAFSNKAHDGYLGNAVVGEWCNLGADTNASNLKNNYSSVQIWNDARGSYQSSGLQNVGLLMGDHTKCGISTMFNTGTVVGVGALLYGSGFHAKNIPSFAWGGPEEGYTTHDFDKMIQTAQAVMARRDMALSEKDLAILREVFSFTAKFRTPSQTDRS